MAQDIVPEFSRIVDADKIPPRGMQMELTATPKECAALARRLGLLAVAALSAQLHLHRGSGRQVEVNGTFAADVAQQCVVTLEPVEAALRESVHGLFAPPEQVEPEAGDIEITDVMVEELEPIKDGGIDVGELVTQHLALALEPWPRKPGAELRMPEADAAARQHPFAKLKVLIDNDKE